MASDWQGAFFGRILPEREGVWISPVHLTAKAVDGRTHQLAFQVDRAQILISVSGDVSPDLLTLRNELVVVCRLFADVLGWTHGRAYGTELTSFIGPLSAPLTFHTEIPALAAAKRKPPADTFENLIRFVLSDAEGKLRPLRLALADLRQAILIAEDTPFHCFRAVESLMWFFGLGSDRDRGRKELCRRLNIQDKWILKRLEVPAGEIRHGKPVPVSSDQRERALSDACQVIERMVVLADRKMDTLPLNEFAMLEP